STTWSKARRGRRCRTPTSCSACPRPPRSRRSGSCHEASGRDAGTLRRSEPGPERPGAQHRERAEMSVTAVPGFAAGGLASGLKAPGAPDPAIVATIDGAPVTAAGVFTGNRVAAAPVQISRRHLADGRAAAVVLSSGNANAATGEQGRADALRMCELTAQAV